MLEEQVNALFRTVILSVSVGVGISVIVVLMLLQLDMTTPLRGGIWVGSLCLGALSHAWLLRRFRQLRPKPATLKNWAYAFAAFCLAEGFSWGALSIAVVPVDDIIAVAFAQTVTVGISAGAIPAYSAFMPAYLGILLPACIPFIVIHFATTESLWQSSIILISLFIAAMTVYSLLANRSFRQQILLRLQTEKLANDLAREKAIAEEANRSKSRFLAAASHDLRQPVHALNLSIGALELRPLNPGMRAIVAQMAESITAMGSLFNALLDISRLDAGVIEVHRKAFRVEPVMRRIFNDHLPQASAKGLALSMVSTAAIVDCDPILFERILRNFVSNAVRYTHKGKVLIGCLRADKALRVLVLDTGPGIPEEEHGRIFSEFYQLNNSARDRSKGLGLGLAVVRRLVDLLGCSLLFRSRLDHGSCFGILVPLAEKAIEDSATEIEPLVSLLTTGFLLAIDDEDGVREAMGALLAGWGHKVVTAASGDEALGILAGLPQRPDLIVCDYRLRDGENGIDVIRRIRSEYNTAIPALLVSGDTAPDRLAEAKASKLLLLHKPIRNGQFRVAINNLLHMGPQEE